MVDHAQIYFVSVALSCALLLLASLATLYRIYKNSKSVFAYTLVAFTLADSISALVFLVANARHPERPEVIGFLDQYFSQLLPLQSWIFAMKYLESALIFSMQRTPLTPRQHIILTVSVIAFYVSLVASLDILDDVGFKNGKERHGFSTISVFYDLMYLVSTIITLCSIHRVYKTIQKMQRTSSSLGINTRAMSLHVLLLILTSCLALL